MNVLISEVAGPGRWSQFNLRLDWIPTFFGASADQAKTVPLCTLDAHGNILSQCTQTAMYKPNSRNWAFEIPGASELDYPGKAHRPILVIAQSNLGYYPFELVMPTENPYIAVASFLVANRQTPANHLARCIVARGTLPPNLFGLRI